MATELTTWQVVDMNRKYPATTLQEKVAETSIFPRSRLELAGLTIPRIRHLRRRTRSAPKGLPVQRAPSTRPVLRPVLLQYFHDRMTKLLETLTWRR
jgi:hypothetical protein